MALFLKEKHKRYIQTIHKFSLDFKCLTCVDGDAFSASVTPAVQWHFEQTKQSLLCSDAHFSAFLGLIVVSKCQFILFLRNKGCFLERRLTCPQPNSVKEA